MRYTHQWTTHSQHSVLTKILIHTKHKPNTHKMTASFDKDHCTTYVVYWTLTPWWARMYTGWTWWTDNNQLHVFDENYGWPSHLFITQRNMTHELRKLSSLLGVYNSGTSNSFITTTGQNIVQHNARNRGTPLTTARHDMSYDTENKTNKHGPLRTCDEPFTN